MLNNKKLRAALDLIAQEGFRDVADYDYVAARVSFRLDLRDQFYWSSLQCIEKYLKAILLFNGVKVKSFSHQLEKIYNCLREATQVRLHLDEVQLQLLRTIEGFGNNRYRTRYTRMLGDELPQFDRLIWTIRHYARSTFLVIDGVDKTAWYLENFCPPDPAAIPTLNQLPGGQVEKILDRDVSDRHRQELVWCNRCYGQPENADQIPERTYTSSYVPVYERDGFLNGKVEYKKTLAEAIQEFVKYP